MNLYEIDQGILDCIDNETGEIIDVEKLSELQMERERKIESVALWIKNLNADAAAYKAEKDAFAEREKRAKDKAESLKKWLTMALDGEKLTTNRCAVSFRKSESVEIENEIIFVDWAQSHRDDLLTFKDPTPNKTAIKLAIKNGSIDAKCGVHLVEKQNLQIK